MMDPRHRLRPLLHAGVAYKVKAAIDEIIARDDPALYDWVLEAVHVTPLTSWESRRWQYDDAERFSHPSLEPDDVLRLVAHGNSELAAGLRESVVHLGFALDFNHRHEPAIDLSAIGRMRGVEKLRVVGVEPPSEWEWRVKLAAGEPKPLVGFGSIAGMSALEHLTIIAGAGVDMAPLAELPRLRYIELVACDTADLGPLARTSVETLVLAGCNRVAALDALPPTLRRLHIEDLPALASIDGVLRAPGLEILDVAGVPLLALPALPPSVQVTFQTEHRKRTSY